jgi:DNA-binding transcriptional MerR regulator
MKRSQKRKLTTRLLCDRYNVTSRTIDRWVEQGILPKPMFINSVRYWDEDEIDRRDQERLTEANRQAPSAGEAAA